MFLLIVAILVNQPRVTVVVSAVGLIAGAFVLRRGNVQRVAMVAMAGLAAACSSWVFLGFCNNADGPSVTRLALLTGSAVTNGPKSRPFRPMTANA